MMNLQSFRAYLKSFWAYHASATSKLLKTDLLHTKDNSLISFIKLKLIKHQTNLNITCQQQN